MTNGLEPQIRTYGGDYSLAPCDDAVAAESDLRKKVEAMWPDITRPAKVIVLPLEDYQIMLSDLAGQIYTPQRKGLLLTLAEPQKPVAAPWWRAQAKQWVQAIWKAGVMLCAYYGAIQIADLIWGRQ